MNTYQIIELPLKPHLKQFVMHKLGKEPIVIREDDLFGKVFFSALKKSNNYRKPDLKDFGDNLQLSVSKSGHRAGVYMPNNDLEPEAKSVAQLNCFFDNLFDSELFTYLRGGEVAKKEIKASCEKFLAEYGITEDEMKLDTALRRYRRYKEQKEKIKRELMASYATIN